MNQTPHQTLLKLLQKGVAKCAERLGKLSYSTWEVDTVLLCSSSSGTIDDLMDKAESDHFGTFLAMPGGGFLMIFPPKSGFLVANRFTLSGADPVDALADRESKVLAEVSNIIVNALTDVLAEACSRTLMLSSPQSLKGPKKEILRLTREKLSAASQHAWTGYMRLKTPTFSSDCDLLIFLDAELLGLTQ